MPMSLQEKSSRSNVQSKKKKKNCLNFVFEKNFCNDQARCLHKDGQNYRSRRKTRVRDLEPENGEAIVKRCPGILC